MKLNPFSDEFTADPFPIYKRLRDNDPLHFNDEMNFFAVSRYDDIIEVFRDPETYSSAGGVTLDGTGAGTPMLLVKDNPEHRWHKNLAFGVFTRERMNAMEGFARALCIKLIEAAGQTDECDAVEDFSVGLPLNVISELIGIPEDYRAPIHDLANALIQRGDSVDPKVFYKMKLESDRMCAELIRMRRETPGDDIITVLINTPLQDDTGVVRHLTDEELAARFMELAGAGHETVAKAIPNAMAMFNRFPGELGKVLDDPSLIPNAVEETMRFEAPAQTLARTTTREVELHGKRMPAGARVLLLLGSATRDERHFENPDVFDVTRESDVISAYFGYGIHRCLGIHLARMEIRVALEELLNRYPNFRTFPERGKRVAMANVRGYASLPVQFGAHA